MDANLDGSVIIDPHAADPSKKVKIIDPRVSEPQGEVEIITPSTALSVHKSDVSNAQRIGDKVAQAIERLPKQIVEFYTAYSRPINLLGALFLGLLMVAIASGVLRVLNALPLVAPSLKLIGIGYVVWFSWRYLLYAESRHELATRYQQYKQRVVGQNKEIA